MKKRRATPRARRLTPIAATATTAGMADYIPNVSTNVGYALPDATDPTHIVAISWRIYTFGGRVKVPANHEFGDSEHVSTVVLAAIASDLDMRAVLNLATGTGILDAAREQGRDTVEFDADYENRNERPRDRSSTRDAPLCLIYHHGAFEIEPITYVLGKPQGRYKADDSAHRNRRTATRPKNQLPSSRTS